MAVVGVVDDNLFTIRSNTGEGIGIDKTTFSSIPNDDTAIVFQSPVVFNKPVEISNTLHVSSDVWMEKSLSLTGKLTVGNENKRDVSTTIWGNLIVKGTGSGNIVNNLVVTSDDVTITSGLNVLSDVLIKKNAVFERQIINSIPSVNGNHIINIPIAYVFSLSSSTKFTLSLDGIPSGCYIITEQIGFSTSPSGKYGTIIHFDNTLPNKYNVYGHQNPYTISVTDENDPNEINATVECKNLDSDDYTLLRLTAVYYCDANSYEETLGKLQKANITLVRS